MTTETTPGNKRVECGTNQTSHTLFLPLVVSIVRLAVTCHKVWICLLFPVYH